MIVIEDDTLFVAELDMDYMMILGENTDEVDHLLNCITIHEFYTMDASLKPLPTPNTKTNNLPRNEETQN